MRLVVYQASGGISFESQFAQSIALRRHARLIVLEKVLLAGPYGGRNIGDNLILELLLRSFEQAGVTPLVACSDPVTVRDVYGVETCSLLEYRLLKVESLWRLKSVGALVIGGGEQLAEPRIRTPFWGHLASVAHLVRTARLLRKPSMLWSVGLDELQSPISRWLLRNWVCGDSTTICLRDDASIERMNSYCGSRLAPMDLHRTADPAFQLAAQDKAAARAWLYKEVGVADCGRKTLLLVPANDKLANTDYVRSLAEYGRRQAQAGWQVFGLVTDLQPSYDLRLKEILEWQAIEGFRWLPSTLYMQEQFARLIAGVDLVVSARMHPLIVALTQSTPAVVLVRSAKMDAFARMCELPRISTGDATVDAISHLCSKVLDRTLGLPRPEVLVQRRAEAEAAEEVFTDKIRPLLSCRRETPENQ